MEIELTEHQKTVIQKYTDDINAMQQSLKIAEGLRSSFVSGIGSANGIEGTFAFQIKDGVLIINEPEPSE